MSAAAIDAYLAGLASPQRETLEEMRRRILGFIPGAEQVISYSLPGFRVAGKVVAGLGAFVHHNSYLPHSGSVLAALVDDVAGYSQTKGSLHFALDEPLPPELIRKLLAVRLDLAAIAHDL